MTKVAALPCSRDQDGLQSEAGKSLEDLSEISERGVLEDNGAFLLPAIVFLSEIF